MTGSGCPDSHRLPPFTPISALLSANVAARGDALAIRIHHEGRWERATWREFATLASAAATRIAVQSAPGLPVLMSVDNSVASLATLVGLAVAGIDFAVFEAEGSVLRDEKSALHTLGAVTVVGAADAPTRYRSLPAEDLTRPVAGRDALADLTASAGSDSVVWQSTSGSTGEPRLASQTMANLLRGGAIYTRLHRVTERDSLLATVPLAHSFGLVGGLTCALVSGASLTAFTAFSARGVREAIEAGATVALGTPLVYELLTRTTRPTSSALRVALSSGGPLEPSVADAARRRLGCPVCQVYGSTEMGIIASQSPQAEPWPAGHVGEAAPGVAMRLADGLATQDQGRELSVRTTTMFTGYWGGADPVFDADGWYRTGDLATLDQAGHLRLVRRKDSFINVGGRKVNPSRVERLIAGHDAVAEVVVYGVETVGGEEVWATVAFCGAGTAEDLLARCRAHLASYEVPHRVNVLSRLPRNGMGKVDRSQLPRRP